MANGQPVIRQANPTGKLTAPPTTTAIHAAKCTVFEALIVILGRRSRERSRSRRNLSPHLIIPRSFVFAYALGQFGRQAEPRETRLLAFF